MTVQELIDILQTVQDKNKKIVLFHNCAEPTFAGIDKVDMDSSFDSTVYLDYSNPQQ